MLPQIRGWRPVVSALRQGISGLGFDVQRRAIQTARANPDGAAAFGWQGKT